MRLTYGRLVWILLILVIILILVSLSCGEGLPRTDTPTNSSQVHLLRPPVL